MKEQLVQDRKASKALSRRRSIVSLFCGPGGMDLGFKRAGFTTVLALDHSEAAVRTYNANNKDAPALKCDLASTRPKEVAELVRSSSSGSRLVGVVGGPPCQAFS